MTGPEVLSIDIDIDRIAYTFLTKSSALVGATSVQASGVTGAGVSVAILP